MVLLMLWFLLLSIALFCIWVENHIDIFLQKKKQKKRRKKKECLSDNGV